MEYKIPNALRSDRFTLNSFPVDITQIGDAFNYPTIKLSQGAVCLLGSPYTGNILDAVIITNYTDQPIVLIDRDNRARTIQPSELTHSGEVEFMNAVVIEKITVKQQRLNNSKDEAFHRYSKIRQLLRRSTVRGFYEGYGVVDNPEDYHFLDQAVINNVEYHLTNNGGAVYLEAMGYVIAHPDTQNVTFLHPHTDSITKMELCPTAANESSAFLELIINDTEHLYEKVFVNLAGQVMEIPVQRNPLLENGIHYVTGVLDNFRNKDKSSHYFQFGDKLCPIKIFGSKSEAETMGDVSTIAEQEILRLKHDLALSKERVERLKNEQAEKSIEITRMNHADRKEELTAKNEERERNEKVATATYRREISEQKYKATQAQIARERSVVEAERNAKIETTSFWRKMAAESVKVVAAAVSIAATVFAWIKLRG